jgi:hypothetical protein
MKAIKLRESIALVTGVLADISLIKHLQLELRLRIMVHAFLWAHQEVTMRQTRSPPAIVSNKTNDSDSKVSI